MFNLGFSELIIIGVIALVFIGPKQLPEVARLVGRMINEWKRATNELTSTFTENEAFKDWEDRKQKYFSEMERVQGKEEPGSEAAPETEDQENTQLEMNLEEEKKS